jgi:hypothetical protein
VVVGVLDILAKTDEFSTTNCVDNVSRQIIMSERDMTYHNMLLNCFPDIIRLSYGHISGAVELFVRTRRHGEMEMIVGERTYD